jgi:hypothetical protein
VNLLDAVCLRSTSSHTCFLSPPFNKISRNLTSPFDLAISYSFYNGLDFSELPSSAITSIRANDIGYALVAANENGYTLEVKEIAA